MRLRLRNWIKVRLTLGCERKYDCGFRAAQMPLHCSIVLQQCWPLVSAFSSSTSTSSTSTSSRPPPPLPPQPPPLLLLMFVQDAISPSHPSVGIQMYLISFPKGNNLINWKQQNLFEQFGVCSILNAQTFNKAQKSLRFNNLRLEKGLSSTDFELKFEL